MQPFAEPSDSLPLHSERISGLKRKTAITSLSEFPEHLFPGKMDLDAYSVANIMKEVVCKRDLILEEGQMTTSCSSPREKVSLDLSKYVQYFYRLLS